MMKIRVTRDSAIFVSGLAILFHETVLTEAGERPQLLIIAAMMIGLPAFLRKDEKQQQAATTPVPPPAPPPPPPPKPNPANATEDSL